MSSDIGASAAGQRTTTGVDVTFGQRLAAENIGRFAFLSNRDAKTVLAVRLAAVAPQVSGHDVRPDFSAIFRPETDVRDAIAAIGPALRLPTTAPIIGRPTPSSASARIEEALTRRSLHLPTSPPEIDAHVIERAPHPEPALTTAAIDRVPVATVLENVAAPEEAAPSPRPPAPKVAEDTSEPPPRRLPVRAVKPVSTPKPVTAESNWTKRFEPGNSSN